jgi:hypothetical protein
MRLASWNTQNQKARTRSTSVRLSRLTTSRATARRRFVARGAVGGSAMPIPRMKSGIHVRCRLERRAAKHRTPASLVSKVNNLAHRQWLRRDSKATCVLFVSTASAAASFRSKCGSKRSPPECSSQPCPAATPHVGQGMEDHCLGVRSFILIPIFCADALS